MKAGLILALGAGAVLWLLSRRQSQAAPQSAGGVAPALAGNYSPLSAYDVASGRAPAAAPGVTTATGSAQGPGGRLAALYASDYYYGGVLHHVPVRNNPGPSSWFTQEAAPLMNVASYKPNSGYSFSDMLFNQAHAALSTDSGNTAYVPEQPVEPGLQSAIDTYMQQPLVGDPNSESGGGVGTIERTYDR
ncbi:MAG TPA: hypothetical protein VG167_15035 [Verrucomicrobiae bacterium]|nr:hypothetical protein [Verrucomicrobiae bacterium]